MPPRALYATPRCYDSVASPNGYTMADNATVQDADTLQYEQVLGRHESMDEGIKKGTVRSVGVGAQ
jgi:hypothetical protein